MILNTNHSGGNDDWLNLEDGETEDDENDGLGKPKWGNASDDLEDDDDMNG